MHDALIALELFVAILLILIAIPLYFLPYFIASKRDLPKQRTIGWLNLFLGWTTVAWVALIIFASLADPEGSRGRAPQADVSS